MRTFRYILSLLAATLALLAQPAMAQAPETSTKAQPSDPVFPYLLTIQQPAEGATLDVMIMNAAGTYTAVSSGQTVYNGTKVDLFFAPQEGYRLTEGSITYNGNATTAEPLAPNDKFYYNNNRENEMTWGDTGVSWYYPQDDQYYPPSGNQMNAIDTTYYYLVLGYSNDGEQGN